MQGNPQDKNRRQAQRADAAFTLTYGVEKPYSLRVSLGLSDDIDALMRDLSDSGVAIITRFELPKGALLHIKFNFINLFLTGQERSRRMEISAEVVSCADLGRGNYRVGTRFNNISEEDKIAIRNFIRRSK
ncbi:MAG: PilZ domain-containing protein [Candidatus Omnitrophica bacterium]|nr:PilZ domain-containing protein [Candidatus Omnitrophota bacterium]